MERETGLLQPRDTKRENRGTEEKHETQNKAGATETQDTMGTNKDEVQFSMAGLESDVTTTQNRRKEESGAKLDARVKEKKDEGEELEEGELIESGDEDNPANIPSNLVEESTAYDNELQIPFESKISPDNQCQLSGYRPADVTLKNKWSRSSDHSFDTPDVLPNKRRCLCSGKNYVDEAHERIQNVIINSSLILNIH